jgi:NTE family protein
VKRALVLAGGGVAGIAWELGVLQGLRDADAALADAVIAADLVVGTSAGSAVAAQITSGVPIDELYAAQLREESAEIEVELDMDELFARLAAAAAGATAPQEVRRAIGELALDTSTVPESVRHAAIEARLPNPAWPQRALLITAVDAQTGEAVVFSKESGVALVDAVAASCAVPGIWPPVTINGRRYIDGGTRSGTNADLAVGSDRVLVLIPSLPDRLDAFNELPQEIEVLKPSPVHAVYADEAAVAAFGANPLSPTTRGPAARAGHAAGLAAAGAIGDFWV